MVVGKGSLFLGRMTSQFDGISVLVERNQGIVEDVVLDNRAAAELLAEAMRKVADELEAGGWHG